MTKPDTPEYFSAYTTSSGNPSRRRTCKQCMSERAARHNKERPHLRAASAGRRRERDKNAEGSHSDVDLARLLTESEGKCFYCGITFNDNWTVDHMNSLAKGGTNWPSNLALACKTCNFDKHTKDAVAFVRWRQLHGLPCSVVAIRLLGRSA